MTTVTKKQGRPTVYTFPRVNSSASCKSPSSRDLSSKWTQTHANRVALAFHILSGHHYSCCLWGSDGSVAQCTTQFESERMFRQRRQNILSVCPVTLLRWNAAEFKRYMAFSRNVATLLVSICKDMIICCSVFCYSKVGLNTTFPFHPDIIPVFWGVNSSGHILIGQVQWKSLTEVNSM